MRMFGGTLRCEHALADQAEAQVLLDGDKHFADLLGAGDRCPQRSPKTGQ